MFGGYTFEGKSSVPVLKALLSWGMLELTEGWRTWFGSRAKQQDEAMPTARESKPALVER